MGLIAVSFVTMCLVLLALLASGSASYRASQSRNTYRLSNPSYTATNPPYIYEVSTPANFEFDQSRNWDRLNDPSYTATNQPYSHGVSTSASHWRGSRPRNSHKLNNPSYTATNQPYIYEASTSANFESQQYRRSYGLNNPAHTATNPPYSYVAPSSENFRGSQPRNPGRFDNPSYMTKNPPYSYVAPSSENFRGSQPRNWVSFDNNPSYMPTIPPYSYVAPSSENFRGSQPRNWVSFDNNPSYMPTNPPYSYVVPGSAGSNGNGWPKSNSYDQTVLSYSSTEPSYSLTSPETIPDRLEDSIQLRIVSGDLTTINLHPYQLALEGGGSHLCGGSILSVDWAITAAHCLHDQRVEWLKFRSGSTSREEGGIVHQVVNFTCHENFTLDSLDYDVAVAFVKDKFNYKDSVMPAILNTEKIKGKMAVTATGWGYKQRTLLTKPKELLKADLVTVDWDTCRRQLSGQLTERMMCAGDPNNKTDICSGDSGGPLVLKGTHKLVGIVSWSYACADGRPSVYTDISSLNAWIRQKVGFDDDQIDLPDD